MKTTRYFEEQVLRKRPYIRREWCELALAQPVRVEEQEDGRVRHWVYIMGMDRYLRVVTLEDGETVHKAGPDLMKLNYYPETDSLYIELTDRNSVDSQEASPGVVLDFDSAGALVGIDIDNASAITDVTHLNGRTDALDAERRGSLSKVGSIRRVLSLPFDLIRRRAG